jgi:hypothetical protein
MIKRAVCHLMLLVMLVGCAASGEAAASMDPEIAKQRATAFAERVGMPWGEELTVEVVHPHDEVGEELLVKYFDFAYVAFDVAQDCIAGAHDSSASVEFAAQPTVVNLTEDEALARATEVAEAMDLFREPVALYMVRLAPVSEQTQEWVVMWVRTTEGIPYERDFARLALDPSNGRLMGVGQSFRSAPPESTEVKVAQEAAVAAAREHARALGFEEVRDMPPTAELKVVQPNNYWGPGERVGDQYMAPSRVAWSVAIGVPYGPEGGYTYKVLWIDAADGELLGGYGYRGATSPPAAPIPAEPDATASVGQSLLIPVTAGGAAILALIGGLLVRARRAAAR